MEEKVENMDDKEDENNPNINKQALVVIEEKIQALDAQILIDNEKALSVYHQHEDLEWQADEGSSG